MFSAKRLNKLWYQRSPYLLYCLLAPFSWLFTLIVKTRRFYYQAIHPPQPFPIPIMIIGNLTVGGVGKTPVVMTLLEYALAQKIRVGLITRGYRSQAEHAPKPILIQAHHTAQEVGDEPLMIFKRTAVPCAVHANRLRAAQALLAAHPDLQLILSDDGLQHLALPRAIEVIVEGSQGFGNGRLLPQGPLREPLSRLKDVDFILKKGQDFTLQPIEWIHLASGQSYPLDFLRSQTVQAVAGIAHPDAFFNTLIQLGLDFQSHAFSDHHHFTDPDFQGFKSACIVMTEKDAVKCEHFGLPNAFYLKIRAVISCPQLLELFAQN